MAAMKPDGRPIRQAGAAGVVSKAVESTTSRHFITILSVSPSFASKGCFNFTTL